MEYSKYFLIRPAEIDKIRTLDASRSLFEADDGWAYVVSEDEAVPKAVDIAVDFHNDEWACWGFSIFSGGKVIFTGLFGENGESGISFDDNELIGELSVAAVALGVDETSLREVTNGWENQLPDIQAFADLLGFGVYQVSPYD